MFAILIFLLVRFFEEHAMLATPPSAPCGPPPSLPGLELALSSRAPQCECAMVPVVLHVVALSRHGAQDLAVPVHLLLVLPYHVQSHVPGSAQSSRHPHRGDMWLSVVGRMATGVCVCVCISACMCVCMCVY